MQLNKLPPFTICQVCYWRYYGTVCNVCKTPHLAEEVK